MALTPQLRMLRPTLAGLPPLELPEGHLLRASQPGDAAHWERIVATAFGGEPGRYDFERILRSHPSYRPERILFVTDPSGRPVATASAWQMPGILADAGTVHYVAVLPEAQGRHLGTCVTLATLHHMVAEGFTRATLTTDDFRLAAIRTYLRLGFEPVLVHENQRERWRRVLSELGLPEAARRFAAILDGPLWPTESAG